MATIKLSHIFATFVALFIFDKWLDRKVKSFIDYAATRGRSIEHFQPFEPTMRVMDGRMFPDSPHMSELPSLAGPQTDVLAPLSSSIGGSAQWLTPVQAQLSAMPPPKTFLPITERGEQQPSSSGAGTWKASLIPASRREIEHIAGNDTPLVELGSKYQSFAQQNGSQTFDQLMTDLDAQPNLAERYQDSAVTFSV